MNNIFDEEELVKESVVAKIATTASDGKTYMVDYYNLDAIISVGYRIQSKTATQFRRWATERLKEYMLKGFTMDDERLKQLGGGAHWKEFLDRIRDICSSSPPKNPPCPKPQNPQSLLCPFSRLGPMKRNDNDDRDRPHCHVDHLLGCKMNQHWGIGGTIILQHTMPNRIKNGMN